MLLANKSYWMGEGKEACPILVVCYTNHALDQFLEGIYSFCRDEIVRVGGQSKNLVLEPFLLKNIRMKNRREKKRPLGVHHGEKDVLDQLYQNKTQIETASEKIKSTTSKIAPILAEEYVDKVIAPAHYEAIKQRISYRHKQKALEIWLGITTEEQEEEINSMEKLTESVKLKRIWKDLILGSIMPLSREEASAVTDALNLSPYTRAQLYAAWLAEGIENLEATLENLTTDNSIQRANIERKLAQMRMNILELKTLQTLPLSARFKTQIDQLHQIEIKQKSVGHVATWLCLDSSKKSTKSIKTIIESTPADVANFQKDDDLIEERRLDDEDDDFIAVYRSHRIEVLKKQKLDETEWVTVHRERKLGPKLRKILSKAPSLSEEDVEQFFDVWNITTEQKYELYRYWVRKYRSLLKQNIVEYEGEYEKAAKKLKEIVDLENLEILRDAAVVGMTTTGAAKNRSVLQQVKPKIIIVEEAAEILEAHIITTLNENCQHLILIGDHKQLRPSPTVYDLAKRYKLDVSLFERLIRNGLPCVTLSEQHRMRPEISVLMRHEHLYPNLKDHISVRSYEIINGVESSVCFIDHTETEQQSPESTSYFNKYEAQYLAALCRYLLQQCYTAEQITVLSPYMGQVLALRKEMPKPEFDGVRITAVDNFQGEENDIILLSLVRSSHHDAHFSKRNPIGFLGIENRVCVALSRAKKGLFVMGNFSLLAENNEMWQYMVNIMRNRNKLKTSLTLHCQNHPDSAIVAAKPEDFKEAPEGGCKLSCDFPLQCGHICRKYCHILDREHEVYKCLKPCAKVNNCGHQCQKKCFDECEPCEQLVKKEVPMCGHKELMKCHFDPAGWFCKSNCNALLPCGHECARRCGDCVKSDQHRQLCERKTERKWPCGHIVTTKCCNGPDIIPCPQPCGIDLNCKHTCGGTCGECLEGRLHKSCTSTCNKILPCGHHCSHNCSEICPPCNRPCDWICLHGVKCKNKCYEECHKCVENCALKCKHKRCGKTCHEECENAKCDEPCDRKLECGHPCAGLCGEQCPKQCPACEPDKFNNPKDKIILLKDCNCIVSVSDLDRHMEQTLKSSDLKLAPLFRCPNAKCNKPIMTTAKRYINYIKKRRWFIFNRYLALTGTPEERKQESKKLHRKLQQLLKTGLRESEAKFLEGNIKDDKFGSLHNSSRTIEIMEDLLKLYREIILEQALKNNKNILIVAAQVEKIRKTLMVKRKCVTSQFWNEAKQEVKELRSWLYSKEDIRNRPPALGIRNAETVDTESRAENSGGDPQQDEPAVSEEVKSSMSVDLGSESKPVDEFDTILNEIQLASDEIVVASDEIDT